MGLRCEEGMCPAWQPLSHHSIPVFGALGSHHEDFEPFQLLTLDLCLGLSQCHDLEVS